MTSAVDDVRRTGRLMSYTAAAMYGGAAFAGLAEAFIPGTPNFSLVPGIVAIAMTGCLLLGAQHTPGWVLALLGPLGVGLIGYAVATSEGPGDGAVLYMWPVLWTAYFYGRRGATGIVACIGVTHALVLLTLPSGAYVGRWVDVMVSVSIVAAVVQMLSARASKLLARVVAEARTDTLTGVFNRRGFEEHAASLLAHAQRAGESIAVASLDLDHFKDINDHWGHDAGDRALTRFASLLAHQSRGIDIVARFGGEEFGVLLPECTAIEADAFTQRIRAALLADFARADLPSVRVSSGVAAEVAPPDLRALLQNADAALYAAKRAGRDRTVVYQGDRTIDADAATLGHSRGERD